ncbi:hypothetical protein GUJ93_ZPchr0458g22660 [Zizania palustris]|uniref:Potassium channel tetramerisation-type BTB domain-containing protein n=1 Tax=Zizania palustris TaxID=103762 RepID=A0A8J5RRJ5_ZIZPA|nr:hypothetical protein GUJ93_ZPchr0458g22660 [Zizania palustris]
MASTFVVTLNVGGELFQTTAATLSRAGVVSPLASLGPTPVSAPHFLDRDSRLFALLLFFLRRGSLASSAPPSAVLLSKVRHFGVDAALIASLSPALAFSPLALRPYVLLPLDGCVAPSAVAVSLSPHSAALFAAHGGVVTRFNTALASRSSVLTPLPTVDSLVAMSPALALSGARVFPGVHLFRIPDDGPTTAREEAGGKKLMRRNWLGSGPSMATTSGGGEEGVKEKTMIVSWAFGGSRMVLARDDKQSIEVWDSTMSAISVNP